MNNRHISRIVVSIAIILTLLPTCFLTQQVHARTLDSIDTVYEGNTVEILQGYRDDIYDKLRSAAFLSLIMNSSKICLDENYYNGLGFIEGPYGFETDEQVYIGDIYNSVNVGSGHKAGSLWLENLMVEGSPTTGGIGCRNGYTLPQEDWLWRAFTGIFPIWAHALGYVQVDLNVTYRMDLPNDYYKLYCYHDPTRPQGMREKRYMGGILFPFKMHANVVETGFRIQMCEDIHFVEDHTPFDPNAGVYKWRFNTPYDGTWTGDAWSGDVDMFDKPDYMGIFPLEWQDYEQNSKQYGKTKFATNNQYLPSYGKFGIFNNTDGYYNYLRDFNLYCGEITTVHDTKESDSWYPITTYKKDPKEPKRLIAKRRYYELKGDKTWTYPISQENSQTSCSGLIERIEYLRMHPNGVEHPIYSDEINIKDRANEYIGDGRDYGYEGIILNALRNACNRAYDPTDGENIYVKALKWLDEKIEKETDSIKKAEYENERDILQKAMDNNNFMTASGDESERAGKVYQCLETDHLRVDVDEYDPPDEDIRDPDEVEDLDDLRAEASCYDNGGVLEYILCPLIESVGQFIVQKYAEWVEPALQIEPELFNTEGANAGTYQAWCIFRDIANLIFVVFFIIIILSQVTGIGIDNYGIKKALPKLVVAIILINLSFLICQLAVDICNLFGQGLGRFFEVITSRMAHPTEIKTENVTVRASDVRSTWGGTGMWLGSSLIVILVSALTVGTVLTKGLAIIIPIFMMVISVGIAILSFIIMLGMRQALSVLLVAVSPLAFVCYMLPNTKPIFNRWFDMFKGLLLAYPICSLLVYGGDMAGTILVNANNGNTWVLIAAAVVTVAPIFIIPKVIKKSMVAISGGIIGLTNRFGNWTKGKTTNGLKRLGVEHGYNYRQQMKQQMRGAARNQYSAKRGRALLKHKKYRDPSKLGARDRSIYNAARGAVNAADSDDQNAFEDRFANMTDEQILTEMTSGEANVNKFIAGINMMNRDSNVTEVMRQMSGTAAFQEMLKSDPNARQRIADALMARRGSVVNTSLGKLIAKNDETKGGETVEQMFKSGSLREKVQGMGAGVMKGQDKDVFNTRGIEDLLSRDQLRATLTSRYGGDRAAAAASMWSRIAASDEKNGTTVLGDTVSDMSAEDLSNMNFSSMNAVGGADTIRQYNQRAIDDLKSEDGKEFRPHMDMDVRAALKIDDHSLTDGIKEENKTADDKNYEAWIDAHAPDEEGEAMKIDHSTPGGSPDLNPVDSKGTKRDKYGKVIGERSKEGTYGDYHPRQKGETSAEYSERNQYEKAVAEWAAAQPPKGENETGEEYRARMKVPKSRDQWKADGGGKIL